MKGIQLTLIVFVLAITSCAHKKSKSADKKASPMEQTRFWFFSPDRA